MLLLLVLVVLPTVGCGGGSSTAAPARKNASSAEANKSTPPGPSAAKSRFIEQADAVCGRLNTELAARKPKKKGVAALIEVVPGNIALEHKALRELGALTPPHALARDWERILGYRKTLASELATLVQDAKHNDVPAINALGDAKKHTHAVLRTLAKQTGFTFCPEVGQ
jgi:hypothetical protein